MENEKLDIEGLLAKRKANLNEALAGNTGVLSEDKLGAAELTYITDVCEKHKSSTGKFSRETYGPVFENINAYKELISGREIKSTKGKEKLQEIEANIIKYYDYAKNETNQSVFESEMFFTLIFSIVLLLVGLYLWPKHKFWGGLCVLLFLGGVWNCFTDMVNNIAARSRAKEAIELIRNSIDINDNKITLK